MALRIRPAIPSDRATLHALFTAQMAEHQLPSDPERIDRGLDAAFKASSPAWLRLAERDGQAVGAFLANQIVSVEKGGETLWIEELYVVPAARRSGVASALLTSVAEEARRRGLRALDLEVVPTQKAALELYAALGFRDVGRLRRTRDL